MSDAMMFPETIEEFIDKYKFIDTDQIYTNGSELIQVFRVMQWVEHERALDAEPTQEEINNAVRKRAEEVLNIVRCEDCKYWVYDNFNDEGEITDAGVVDPMVVIVICRQMISVQEEKENDRL